jgi:hypothetical protein
MRRNIKSQIEISISQSSMNFYFHRLGLSWKNVKGKKKNVGAYRMDALRDFIIEYNTIVREFNRDSNPCTYTPVFTNESYVNQNHAGKYSWLKEDSTVNRSSSRGERLIILHAISPFGPLCEKYDNNYSISDLVWKRDTPHPTTRADGLLTCETLWKSQSSTGDYHDNMNSKMFMKWVEEKLCPTWD